VTAGVRKIRMGMEVNRVEGDMEIQVEVEGGVVTDAWCSGTMFRGYEQILTGRDPADALVITPRICGICSASHLYSATSALEMAYSTPIAPNGTRIRNLWLMAESVMSDARHTFLMFAPDLCKVAYAGHPLCEQVTELFAAPFRGRVARETVEHSKRILQVVICFGGQWPHSTYMMPGGVTCPLDAARLRDCLDAVEFYRAWYERSILGCTTERWLQLRTVEDFEEWLEESASHRDSAIGVFARSGRSIGLHTTGGGTPNLLSMGCYYDPEAWQPQFRDRGPIWSSAAIRSSPHSLMRRDRTRGCGSSRGSTAPWGCSSRCARRCTSSAHTSASRRTRPLKPSATVMATD
jgi:hypothetical protein